MNNQVISTIVVFNLLFTLLLLFIAKNIIFVITLMDFKIQSVISVILKLLKV